MKSYRSSRMISLAAFALIGTTFAVAGCASSDGNVEDTGAQEDDKELAEEESAHGSMTESDVETYDAAEEEAFESLIANDDPSFGIDDADDLGASETELADSVDLTDLNTQAAAAVTPLLKVGLHRNASAALRKIKLSKWRIGQTCGRASASAGTHEKDGTFKDLDGKRKTYCAAVDISTKAKPSGGQLPAASVRNILLYLAKVGFAAWYRDPGHDGWPSNEEHHIHAVYAGVPMKAILDRQVSDFAVCKNGLKSHAKYNFYCAPAANRTAVKKLWDAHN